MLRILPVLAVLLWLAPFVGAAPVINEVQSTNTSLPDQYGQLMDWVEIHNPTGAPIDLGNYYLSDSTTNKLKFRFPASTILQSGAYLVVWCGQASEFQSTGPYPAGQLRATNFNISSGGEPILLTAPDGTSAVDEFPALAIGTNLGTSEARTLGRGTGANFNTLFFYDSPTFGSANTTTGTPTVTLEPPLFSLPAGIYTNGSLSVAISLPTNLPTGVIRYTLDGSEPTTSSPVYGGPLTLNASTTTNTNSYVPTNFDPNPGPPLYEGWQPPASQPFRINVLRARVFASGAAGRVQTASYVQHPSGINRYTMPIVSVATDPANMFSDDRGIYVPGWYNNMFQEGSAWERPGNIEFFEPDGSLAFAGTIGLRLHGNTTRSRPRKSLRIYARNPYGESTFQHRIFPQKEINRFDTFLLRNGGNDWGNSLFRDALVTTLAEPTGLDIQSSRPAAVFISGEYWGIHNLRDRIDEGFFFNHYGLGTTSFSQIEVIPTADNSTVVADNGSTMGVADFEDLLNRAVSTGFVGDTNYEHLASRIDIDNYIDYNAFEIWSGNTDWPGNNYRLWRSVTADASPGANPRHDGRWRWILFDTDFGLGADFAYVPGHNSDVATMAQFNSLAHATADNGELFSNRELGTRLLRKALENSGFRSKFINRFADLLNTTLSPSNTTSKLDQFVALYGPGVPEHVNRWRQPYDWSNDIVRIRTYMQQRPTAVRGHIAGQFGLSGTANLTVNVANTNQGSVTVNTINIDPSTVGVSSNPYPWTGTYFRGVPVTVTAVPKPGYRFVAWSNSISAGPSVVASDAAADYGSWTNGANGGTGFGPWSLNTTTGDTRKAGTFLDNPRGGWGLYANDYETAWVERSLSNSLQVGETFAARVKHGSVEWPGEVGFQLANSSGGILFNVSLPWWSSSYVINGAVTAIPATTSPLDIEVTLVTSNSYSARITPVGGSTYTNTGTLLPEGDRTVRRFLGYNYSAGNGGGADFFITSMRVEAPAAPGAGGYVEYSTNATITPTLSAAATFVASFQDEPATALAITPPIWTAGFSNAPVAVRAVNSLGDTDATFTDMVTLTLTGPGGVLGTVTAAAADGVATFAAVDLPAGSYTLSASAGALSTSAPVGLTVRNSASFLPAGSGVWHNAANWNSGAVPNSPAVSVIIPPNTVTNRDVTNNAPTTVAAITFELGASAFRNRINGTTNQPLTLQSTNGTSTVTVTGTGTGHANIEVAGGVSLANDVVLDVQNSAAGNAEYGALRLQGNWSGAGRIIKRGPGMAGITGAGKTFSGDIVIEQGVLTFSEPAITANGVTNYTVQSGGQLRLSSAGNPRNYLFKGPLNLAGNGRSGVPDNENLGVLGALRLETGTTGTLAVLTNTVRLSDSADVHVPAGNAMQFSGPLTAATNTNVLTKSGGGTLVLSSNAATFTGGLAVNRGALRLDNAGLTNTSRTLTLTNETVLIGTGRWGGDLEALSGSTLSFTTAASPGGEAALRAGGFAASGTVTIAVTPGAGAGEGAYPLLAIDGAASGMGNLALALATTNFTASSLSFSNGTLYAVLKNPASAREKWLAQYGFPADGSGDGADTADPDGDGIVNIVERAMFLDPTNPDRGLPAALAEPGVDRISFTYRVAKAQDDLMVRAVTSSFLTSPEPWLPLASTVLDETHSDYTLYRVELPTSENAGFLRLEVTR